MNKNELIDFIANKTDLTKASVDAVINAFGEAMLETMKKGDTMALTGLFTLSIKERAARSGRNPATGETIQIAATTIPIIKAGNKLKAAAKMKQK